MFYRNRKPRNFYNNIKRNLGFTLMEIMIVVVIMGLLATAVTVKVSDYVDKAKINRVKSDIRIIIDAAESFNAEKGRYPTNEEGLDVLSIKSKKDPWGRDYLYNQPGRQSAIEVITFGADGQEGGKDMNADMTSDTLKRSN